MKAKKATHHPVDEMPLRLETFQASPVVRPPLPMDQMYPLDRLEELLDQQPETSATVKVGRRSMFFRGIGRNIDNDPFLKRLSRLN